MSLALSEPYKIGCSPFKFKHYLRACTRTSGKKLLILYAKQIVKSYRVPMKSPTEHNPDIAMVTAFFSEQLHGGALID